MRIGIGQLWQETNTFNPLPTTRADFKDFGVLWGDDLIEHLAQTNELGGFIQSLRAWPSQPQIVGLVRLPAWPSGPLTPATFAWLRDQLIKSFVDAGPLDGVLLALHGAMVGQKHPDVEGEILGEVRRLIGPHIPLVATLDLHAHLTPEMVRAADALVLYHTAPHVDVFETGQRAAALLRRILFDGARPVSAFQKIPMVVPAERANTEARHGLSHELKLALQSLEAQTKILSAGLATVQPWLDVPDLGTAVLVVADDDPQQAREACAAVARQVWERRREYLPDLVPYETAIGQAHQNPSGLVVLGDCADATTAGSPGDNTVILAELLKYDWPRPALHAMVSPEVVGAAESIGPGGRITTKIGGLRDRIHCQPLATEATVDRLFDARFVLSGHLARNLPVDMGRSAVLRLGSGAPAGGVRLVVTSRSGPHFAPELFRSAGLEPEQAAVLIAKSPCGFRAAYEPLATRIIHMSAPGCSPSDFWNYEYRHITRPLWPWDAIDDWQPSPGLITAQLS